MLQKQLLDWYGRHKRVMPWRSDAPDPYHVWLSEIMLQQTTVVTVGPYFEKFIGKWPTVQALAKARLDDVLAAWAGLGYYARARNLHKCAVAVVKEHGGRFPQTEAELLELPGIGPYTAAAIASIAFNQQAVAVDGNVERVVSRFFAILEPDKEQYRARAAELAADNPKPRDFTQALMELGATVCTPRAPKCPVCPWRAGCAARLQGLADTLPRRPLKKKKPLRFGRVFWIENAAGAFLIEKRGDKGLFAGMYQLPTTAWLAEETAGKPPSKLRFAPLGAQVRHVFTHFDLTLDIWTAKAGKGFRPARGRFIAPAEMEKYALPALMRKVVKLCVKA